jgi:hypothetical protein
MQELEYLIELLIMLITDPRNSALFALLIVASISDYRATSSMRCSTSVRWSY